MNVKLHIGPGIRLIYCTTTTGYVIAQTSRVLSATATLLVTKNAVNLIWTTFTNFVLADRLTGQLAFILVSSFIIII